MGELIARSVTNNLYRFVIPAVAGPARLVPLASLVDKKSGLTANALRVAAIRGRLRAQKSGQGTWLSSKKWVQEYQKKQVLQRLSQGCDSLSERVERADHVRDAMIPSGPERVQETSEDGFFMHRETSVAQSCPQLYVPCWRDLGSNQGQASRGVEIIVRGHAPGFDVKHRNQLIRHGDAGPVEVAVVTNVGTGLCESTEHLQDDERRASARAHDRDPVESALGNGLEHPWVLADKDLLTRGHPEPSPKVPPCDVDRVAGLCCQPVSGRPGPNLEHTQPTGETGG